MGLREAACKYNVPVETLRRRTTGIVSLDCRPGPPTVLSTEEEARLAQYCVAMADMGFGLTREGVMAMAYAIVDRTGRDHPFKGGNAGRGHCAHPKLCHMPELSVLIRKQLMISLLSWVLSLGG